MSSPVQIWRNHQKLHHYLGKKGKVITWTKIHVAPLGFEHEIPYTVAIVEFDPPAGGGQRLPLQIVDLDHELQIDDEVITCVRIIGCVKSGEVIEYGIKAKVI